MYRGRVLGSEYFGRYFFADSGSGRVWPVARQLDPATGRASSTGTVDHSAEIGALGSIVSFAEDSSGELYLALYSGRVVKLVRSGAAPSAPTNLTSQTTGRVVQLAWTGASGATQYRIEAGSRTGAADLAAIDTGSGQTTFTANGVGDGVYYARVKALSGVTASAASNEVVIGAGAIRADVFEQRAARRVLRPGASGECLRGERGLERGDPANTGLNARPHSFPDWFEVAFLRDEMRRASGTLRSTDSLARSFVVRRVMRCMESDSGVFGFFVSARITL